MSKEINSEELKKVDYTKLSLKKLEEYYLNVLIIENVIESEIEECQELLDTWEEKRDEFTALHIDVEHFLNRKRAEQENKEGSA